MLYEVYRWPNHGQKNMRTCDCLYQSPEYLDNMHGFHLNFLLAFACVYIQ